LKNGTSIISINETTKLRQREGAYFTPSHIVKFILAHTLAPQLSAIHTAATEMLKEERMDEAKRKILGIGSIRVLDPACGSGSFLIEAFKMITSVYLQYNEAVSKAYKGKSLIEQQASEYVIDKIGERTLLENLYGVDLDAKAVELTKLNLWLQHIDLNRGNYYYSGGAAKKKLLPTLDLNIQCGNSMVCHNESGIEVFNEEIKRIKTIRNDLRRVRSQISLNADEKQIRTLQKRDEELSSEMKGIVKKIENSLEASLSPFLEATETEEDFEKPFDWRLRFPEVFEGGGFDVYVGNPPYINLYKFSGDFRDYLEQKDPEIFRNKNDILYHFYKLGINLLKEGGCLGYITSRYFLEAENADKLRGWLPHNSRIEVLIDWGNIELFQGINTRCVVMVLCKSTDLKQNLGNTIGVAKMKNWRNEHGLLTDLINKHIGTEFYQLPNVAIFHISQSELTDEPWRLLYDEEKRFNALLEENAWRLGGKDGLCKMGMGMQTGLDKAFRVTSSEITSERIPKEFVRKLVRNGDIRRYAVHDRDEYWIYTEDVDVDALPDSHPVKEHLLKYYDELVQRYPCRTTEAEPIPKRNWFQYTVPNIKELFALEEKMIVPYKAPSNRFAMDTERRISSMDVYVLAVKEEHKSAVSRWFILAILNSSLMDYAYITFYGRRKKSEFDYYTGLIEKIPIKKPSQEIHDSLSTLSKEMSELNQTRIVVLDLFKEMIAAEPNEEVRCEHYYDNAMPYHISNKQAFLKETKKDTDSQYEVHHIGIEESGSKLVFEADFRKDGDRVRQKILEITIDDRAIREFLLLSVKSFIERNRGKKILGKDQPLVVVLKNIFVPKFKTNIQENTAKISSLMHEFHSKQIIDKGLSDLEKLIVRKAEQIDELVAELYGLNETQKKNMKELSMVKSVSEYFDRLEEYVGFEDMQQGFSDAKV